MGKQLRAVLALLSLALPAACQTAALMPELSAGVLAEEYEKASNSIRSKYDGKEIRVAGFTPVAPTMPQDAADQGFVLLRAEKQNTAGPVTCWFTLAQSGEFSRITGGQYLTVKGVFNGEGGAALRFCKVIKISRTGGTR